jgi:hypothetical protein
VVEVEPGGEYLDGEEPGEDVPEVVDGQEVMAAGAGQDDGCRLALQRGAGLSPAVGQAPPPMAVPVGFTTFPGEVFAAPRSWVERVYPGIAYFNEVDRGGHFAAWEEPDLFSTEVRAAFRPLRTPEIPSRVADHVPAVSGTRPAPEAALSDTLLGGCPQGMGTLADLAGRSMPHAHRGRGMPLPWTAA